MEIFLSYASEDRELAEQVQLALAGSGHHVFYDKESLPAGNDYHARIRSAVQRADIFVFLISPNSVAQGSYALTELKYARTKWPHPKTRLLPVLLHATLPPHLAAEEAWMSINAVHVTATRLRFGITLKGHSVGGGP